MFRRHQCAEQIPVDRPKIQRKCESTVNATSYTEQRRWVKDKLNNTPDTAKLPAPIAPIALHCDYSTVLLSSVYLRCTALRINSQNLQKEDSTPDSSPRGCLSEHTCGTCAARFVLAHCIIICHWARCPVYSVSTGRPDKHISAMAG